MAESQRRFRGTAGDVLRAMEAAGLAKRIVVKTPAPLCGEIAHVEWEVTLHGE